MLLSVKWMFTRVSIHKMFGKTRMEGCLIQCIILWVKITWQREHLDIWKEVSSCQKDVSLKYRLQALGQNPAWRHILLGFHIFKKQRTMWPHSLTLKKICIFFASIFFPAFWATVLWTGTGSLHLSRLWNPKYLPSWQWTHSCILSWRIP